MDTKKPFCELHPGLTEQLQALIDKGGQHEAHLSTLLQNQSTVFERLRDIQSILDKRSTLDIILDTLVKKLEQVADQNQKNISALKATVENGLSDRTKRIEEIVQALKRRLEIEEVKARLGLKGFLSKAWEDFKEKLGFVLICLVVWLLVWGATKTAVFKEFPYGLFDARPTATKSVK